MSRLFEPRPVDPTASSANLGEFIENQQEITVTPTNASMKLVKSFAIEREKAAEEGRRGKRRKKR